MRGDGGKVFLDVETSRAAYELRKPDAPRRTAEALARARRLNDVDQARGLADVLISNQHRRLDPDDPGPSPETLVKHRRRRGGDTIEALIRTGALEWHQQASALQVAAVYECLTASLWARCCRWEQGRLDGSGSGGGIPERIAQLYQRRYLPWVTWMRDPASLFQLCTGCGRRYTIPRRIDACGCGCRRFWRAQPHLPLVLAVVVYGVGIEAAATEYRMRRQRALRLLQAGLDRFCEFT